MEKLYEKLNTLFLEDANQSAFMTYESFKQYQQQKDMSIDNDLINSDHHVAKL